MTQLNPDDAPDGYVAVTEPVDGNACKGCAFDGDSAMCNVASCHRGDRADETSVIFIPRPAAAPVEKAAPSTPSDARALAQMLMAGADDPMWANHAEVNKATLRRAAEALRFMAGQVECLAACVDPAAFEEVKPSKAARVHAIVNTGPYPGMSEAFNAHMGAECWTDPAYAPDASTWVAAWRAALSAQQAAQPVADHSADASKMVPAGIEQGLTPDAQPVAGEPVPGAIWGYYGEPGVSLVKRGHEDAMIAKNGGFRLYTAAPAPVATDKDSLTVAPAGRLHADGYFTWHRRDGYVLDRRLPCDFYLTPAAAPAPAGLVPLTDEQWLKLRTAKTGQRLRRTHDERARAEFLEWMRFAEAAHGIKAGWAGAK